MTRGTVILAGALAQKPGHGGHAWVFLQYLLGFRKLGWDVLFLDRLEPAMCTDDAGGGCGIAESRQLRWLVDTLSGFGLRENFAVFDGRGGGVGVSRPKVLELARSSAALINVMGYLTEPDVLAAARLRVFLDIDPGFGQMWHALGLADTYAGHDRFVTVGLNVGKPGCGVPTCGREWVSTPPPVALDHWPAEGGGGRAFTTIASWRGPYGPVEYGGKTYGLRVHEFRRFLGLPRRTGLPFELALDIHPSEARDLALLHENGWTLADPLAAAGDTEAYRRFIAGSRAELMIAKNMYVQTGSGWFSDRSACYLAAGRPVLAQDTGLEGLMPAGLGEAGLVLFRTPEEAAEGARAIDADHARHSRAARALAEEVFDSDRVLSRLMERVGAS